MVTADELQISSSILMVIVLFLTNMHIENNMAMKSGKLHVKLSIRRFVDKHETNWLCIYYSLWSENKCSECPVRCSRLYKEADRNMSQTPLNLADTFLLYIFFLYIYFFFIRLIYFPILILATVLLY